MNHNAQSDPRNLPPRMVASLQNYCYEHRPTGGFLEAVLSNDLTNAVRRADPENLALLPAFVNYLIEHAPAKCWGSPEAVREWLAQRTIQ